MTTGWPPGLLQDDSRKLSDWFASRVDARWTVRQVCVEIERNRMTDRQPDPLSVADELEEMSTVLDMGRKPDPKCKRRQAAALLRTQHAAIERKDALLRRAWETLENHEGNYKLTAAECDVVIAVQDAINSELAK